VLTYVPSLPESFQVQMGNIGQHYYDWRYKDAGRGDNGATPAPQPSPGKIQITGAASNPLSLDTAALASRNPQTQNLTIDGQTHIWKGPPLLKLLEEAGGNGHGGRDLPIRYVLATGQNGQRALISWGEIDPIFMGTQAILAYSRDGVNLAGAEAPARLIMPRDKTSARSLFGLARLDVRVITTNTTAGSTLRITGAVQHPLNLTADDLAARNPITVTATYTAGGQIGSFVYKGVPLVRLLNEAGIAATSDKSTRYIVAAGNDGRNAVISWGEIDPDLAGVNVLVAYQQDGVPLGGGIPRLVMPADARGGRYLPYLTSIEVRNAN
jgi:DMSO/TMAO reductase YedYZ molybdopterin-dependent catalytic subunit